MADILQKTFPHVKKQQQQLFNMGLSNDLVSTMRCVNN